MADKYTDDKLYKVVRKDGSHLNTKVNPDGTKSALQFTDDNNDLNGPVDLIEVDEEELIRTEYIQVPQNKRSLGELLVDEVFVPVIRDATTQLLEYGTAKAETWIEEKVVPVAKTKVKTLSSLILMILMMHLLKDCHRIKISFQCCCQMMK